MAVIDNLKIGIGNQAGRSVDRLVSRVIRPLVDRRASDKAPNPNGRRFCIIHLDGVSRDTLLAAANRGYAPFLARLIDSPTYALSPAYAGAPSSTPAFQAGVLYGARQADIPGFWWYDRRLKKQVKMDCASDALRVQQSLEALEPGLLANGSSNFTLFTGGSDVNGWAMSGWAPETRTLLTEMTDRWELAAATANYVLMAGRIAGRVAAETGEMVRDLFQQSREVGRFQHEPTFLAHRLGVVIGAREHATHTTILDIARGVPAIYTVFADYDEVAHRRRPDSRLAMLALWGMDRAVARIFAAARAVPELNYDFYIVSDHGQVETRPFEERVGLTLKNYLAVAEPRADGGPPVIPEEAARRLRSIEALDRTASSLPHTARSCCEWYSRSATRDAIAPYARPENLALLDELTVIEAGDIAHIYLGDRPEPLRVDAIESRYGRLLKILTGCPAVGFVLVRGGEKGIVFYKGQRIDLARPEQWRELAIGYGKKLTAEFLQKMASIPSAGDIVVYGNGLEDGSVAFCWEFGSHAGVAREEVETFVIHPRHADYDFSRVTHGADLHDFFLQEYMRGRRGRTEHPGLVAVDHRHDAGAPGASTAPWAG